ncbi:MAG TPA: radical SAM protein [Thermoanaerobaculia bacterium]|nr:radical SAM protein [Thermoanaerobaculia bacterium]
MGGSAALRVVLVKPSKYGVDGCVERFRRGFMPNSTLPHLKSLTLACGAGEGAEVHAVDEYVETDLDYLRLLARRKGVRTLLALVGVQSHQFHRALDLCAYASRNGVESCVIGGPHPMTCDTAMLQDRGVSFALSEAEVVWPRILEDVRGGGLQPVYGRDQRWERELDPPVLVPPSRRDLSRYVVPMLGVYPARGCPFSCNFCSVIRIAGQRVRSQPVETTLASLRAAKAAGVKLVMFTSDNFNKVPEVRELLTAMIEERLGLPFFAQCDAQVHREEDLVELLSRAGCFQIFVGAESFSREALRGAHKLHNDPEKYSRIVALCRTYGITSHFSNILGFPADTEEGVLSHLAKLRELSPDVASFYLLTPIPGTEQYEEFLSRGLIEEENLDRFDGSEVVWRHPHLSAGRLRSLLVRCYREFYGFADVASKVGGVIRRTRDFRRGQALYAVFGHSALSRLAVRSGTHPMAGGVGRVRLDRAEDYAGLRRAVFGVDRAPLPRALPLSKHDEELNGRSVRRAALSGI